MEQIDQYKYGNIHNLIYFNMDRFNQPLDHNLIDAMADYLYDYIRSMNDFNFDNFLNVFQVPTDNLFYCNSCQAPSRKPSAVSADSLV